MTLRVTLLGTGSPSPSLTRHHPAVLVEWGDDERVLVDAGDGVVTQLLAAGTDLTRVQRIAITHLHWDHILGYPAFVWGSWTKGRTSLEVVGPPGTSAMHDQLVERFYRDQAEWAMELGFRREGWDDVQVRDVDHGWSAQWHGCRIDAGLVVHPPMPSLAYRFTTNGRSVVISGDTARCGELVELSRDADVLVVDACAAPPPPEAPSARAELIQRLHRFHASPQDCVDMAADAGVGTVVLTHHLPETTPEVETSRYPGRVLVGSDLDVIEV